MGQYTATQIYQNIRGGPGPTSLLDAGDAGVGQAQTQQELQDEINRLNAKMGSAWQGNAADAAKTGATPLTQAASDAADALQTHQTNVNYQVESFNYTYQNVNNVPAQGPQNNIVNQFETAIGINTPLDNQMAQYNAQSQQNVELYQAYSDSSTQTADGVPKVYGAIPTENANITIIPPTSGGPGGPGYTGSTGPGGSNLSSTYRSSTTPYTGPTGPTDPNFTPSPNTTAGPVPNPNTTGPYVTDPEMNIPPTEVPNGPNGPTPYTSQPLPPDEYANPNLTLGPNGGTDPFAVDGGGIGPDGEFPGGGGGGGFGGAGGAGGAGADSVRSGSGLGSGAGGENGPGARSGVAGMNASEEAAMRGMPGAAGANGAGGAPMGGRGGRKEEDKEHKAASYLQENDPDALFGSDALTAPPVIGE